MPLDLPTPAAIVMAGLAGAVSPKLNVGDIVLDDLSDPALAQLLPYPKVRMRTVGQIISTPQDRRRLAAETDVVEMENEKVRDLAARLNVPYLGLRAISDAAADTLDPTLINLVDDVGRVRLSALAAALATKPKRLSQLNRLRIQSNRAIANLAGAVQQLILAFQDQP